MPLDIDVFTMDNSNTKKEGVSYTYQGFFGYAPIAAYLGLEGWCLGIELREGSQHSQTNFIPFLERIIQTRKKGYEQTAPVSRGLGARFLGHFGRARGAGESLLHRKVEPAK